MISPAALPACCAQCEAIIQELREAVRTNPDDAQAHYKLANALYNQGKLDQAIAKFSGAIRISPNLAAARNNLAVALYQTGKYSEAWEEVHISAGIRLLNRN